jgi:hypothetical protein
MIETLISGSILAILSALAYIAYHHPVFFGKIYNYLMSSVVIAFVVLSAYNFGVMYARWSIPYDTNKSIEEFKKIREIKDALETIEIPFLYLFVGMIVLAIYFSVLYALPTILKDSQKKKKNIPPYKK